jgi:MFS transporter, SP family, general alpha glucoside:H+ symporter
MTSHLTSDSASVDRGRSEGMSSGKYHPSEFLEFVSIGRPASTDPNEIKFQPNHLSNSQDKDKDKTQGGNDDIFSRISTAMPDLHNLSTGARKATRSEQEMTFITACRRYPKAIVWSILLSSTIIMEGYDTWLIESFFAFPEFTQKYGRLVNHPSGQQMYEISAAWQSALTMGSSAGEIIGLFINGLLADRFGYRFTMVAALIFLTLAILVSFFAANIQMLLVAQILCGRSVS